MVENADVIDFQLTSVGNPGVEKCRTLCHFLYLALNYFVNFLTPSKKLFSELFLIFFEKYQSNCIPCRS